MITAVINFCTNEAQFLGHCLEEASFFSDQILVVVCDHFFDGTSENRLLLNGIYQAHPDVEFIEHAWSEENFYGNHSSYFWHNLSRVIGTHFVEHDWILFLDVDEICEGKKIANWLTTFPYEAFNAVHFGCHWYFRDPHLRADHVEAGPLMVSKKALTYDALMHAEERAGMFHMIQDKKMKQDTPMVHHYSWVRSKEAMLRKVSSWGHRNEEDWKALVEKEFSGSFSGKDFVYGHTYSTVEPYLKVGTYVPTNQTAKNVTRLTTQDVHRIDIESQL